jgi:hypothetical protein
LIEGRFLKICKGGVDKKNGVPLVLVTFFILYREVIEIGGVDFSLQLVQNFLQLLFKKQLAAGSNEDLVVAQ